MPKSLAIGHKKWSVMSIKPADMAAPTVAELTAGVDASCAVTRDSKVSATASDTVDDPALCEVITEKVLTNANAEADVTVFRYFDGAGAAEVTADALFQAMKVRGTRLWIAERNTSKMSADAWKAGDEVSVFEVTTDSWQATDAAGYIKAKIPMQAAAFELNGKVAA